MKRKTSDITLLEAKIGHTVSVFGDNEMKELISVGQVDYPIDGDNQEVDEIVNVDFYKKSNLLAKKNE